MASDKGQQKLSFRKAILQAVEEEEVFEPIREPLQKQFAKEGEVDEALVTRVIAYLPKRNDYSDEGLAELREISKTLSLMRELFLSEPDPTSCVLLAKALEQARHKYETTNSSRPTLDEVLSHIVEGSTLEEDPVIRLLYSFVKWGRWYLTKDSVFCNIYWDKSIISPVKYIHQPTVMHKLIAILVAKLKLENSETNPKKLVSLFADHYQSIIDLDESYIPAILLGCLGSVAEPAVPLIINEFLSSYEEEHIYSLYARSGYSPVEDGGSDSRKEAVWALGMIGSEEAVPTLIKIMRSDYLVGPMAVWALGLIGSKEAIQAIREARYGMVDPPPEGCERPLLGEGELYEEATAALQRLGVSLDDISLLTEEFKRLDVEDALDQYAYWYAKLADLIIPALLPLVEQREDTIMREKAAVLLVWIAHKNQQAIPKLYDLFVKDQSFLKLVEEEIAHSHYVYLFPDVEKYIPLELLKGKE